MIKSPRTRARVADKWNDPPPRSTPPPPSRPVRPVPLAVLVAEIAERVARLAPSHRDPEEFHMAKAELAGELRALARRMERTP